MSDCNPTPEGRIRTICAPAPPRLCARCNERPRKDADYDLCSRCLNEIVKQPGRYGGAPSNGHQVFKTDRIRRDSTGQGGMSGD